MINKKKMVELLESTGMPVNEAISSEENVGKFPRIVFWDYVWDEVDASGQSQGTVVTYQVSVHHLEPRPLELLELRMKLHEYGLRPTMYKEFLQDEKEFHTYFALEVLEDLNV